VSRSGEIEKQVGQEAGVGIVLIANLGEEVAFAGGSIAE
jgi:hypothetical protein